MLFAITELRLDPGFMCAIVLLLLLLLLRFMQFCCSTTIDPLECKSAFRSFRFELGNGRRLGDVIEREPVAPDEVRFDLGVVCV